MKCSPYMTKYMARTAPELCISVAFKYVIIMIQYDHHIILYS